jgi:hypothetical protein
VCEWERESERFELQLQAVENYTSRAHTLSLQVKQIKKKEEDIE